MESNQGNPPTLSRLSHAAERRLETMLFASRWLMAPFYLGLVVALGALLVVFLRELVHERACRKVFPGTICKGVALC